MTNRIHNFAQFVRINEDAGYGKEPFFFAKDGEVSNYFFKVENKDNHRAFVISIGKFSQFTQPTEPKSDYGVLTITELGEDELDQAVTDEGKFDANKKQVDLDDKTLSEIMRLLSKIVADYLDNNAKVNKFYDEIQSKINGDSYADYMKNSTAGWPGEWNFQEVEKGKLNLISK
jgi:hypothetical protein